jgi:hypothetical protein
MKRPSVELSAGIVLVNYIRLSVSVVCPQMWFIACLCSEWNGNIRSEVILWGEPSLDMYHDDEVLLASCMLMISSWLMIMYCHVWGVCVTNNDGFWIGFIGTLLQLQPIITAHYQWLSKTRSIPYWTTSVFSSAVTDLVMIYESVTSSGSLVRRFTLHSWTLNFWFLLRLNHWVWFFC